MPYEPAPTLKDRAKQLIHEGNIRHLVVEKDGRRIADMPLTIVIVAALVAIWLVVLLAILALLLEYRVSIENRESAKDDASGAESAPDDAENAESLPADGVTVAEEHPSNVAVEPESHPVAETATPAAATWPPSIESSTSPSSSPPTSSDDLVAPFDPPPSPEAR